MPTALRTCLVACLLATSALAQPVGISLTPVEGKSKYRMRQEISRLDLSRPSEDWYSLSAVLGASAIVMPIAAGILNIDFRSCKPTSGSSIERIGFDINCHNEPHRDHPATIPLLAGAIASFTVALTILIVVRVLHHNAGARMDLLKEALSHFEPAAARR